ncbi:MAG: hypothetical protein GY711_12320 [bacterium]|nr:hypothetical protein [bacterium]
MTRPRRITGGLVALSVALFLGGALEAYLVAPRLPERIACLPGSFSIVLLVYFAVLTVALIVLYRRFALPRGSVGSN